MPSIIIGPDSTVLFWNAAAERLFGWSSEEVLGRTLPSVPRDQLDEHLRIRQRTLDGEGFSQHRITRLAKDGTPIEVSLSTWPIRRADGRVTAVIGIFADIGVEELRDSEERFRRMVEVAAEGIWIVDIKGNTNFVNNRMAAVLGYTKEEMLGRLCFDFLGPEEHERARRDFAASRKRDIGPQEYRLRHKNGSIVWLDITGTAMFDDAGKLTGILVMCTDVTQRKENEQRLRQTQKLESLGILAAGVAHDFNNLLTGIMGNASLVLETTEPGSRSRTMLQDVITASEQAAQLTRQLLTYAGKDQGKLQPLDMAAVTRELVPLLTASIPKMVKLSLELQDGVPLIRADPAQLQQVMINLVSNAAESIPERTPGEVKVAVGRHRLQPEDYRDAVVPSEADDREYVSFSVTDNGSGMDSATRARIFDPFFSTKFHGRGLGLSAVLGIVKGHGGTLTVRTAPEKGSVFTVLLPASRDARRVETPAVLLPGTAETGIYTILFVDDEAALRNVAQRALEQHGYRVLLAGNGRQAIAVLAAHPEVRAVVLDLAMPVMSGDTAGPMMRSLRPDVPLILSSGYREWDALERVGQGVVAAFLEKPYQAGALVSKLKEVLRSCPGD